MSIKLGSNSQEEREFIDYISASKPLFLLTISYTETSEIEGITIAGANKELIKYTPPADAEFIYYGKCRCIDIIPTTPDGIPTPALLTRAALRLADIPMLVVDAGSKVKPMMPYLSIEAVHGKNIEKEDALDKVTAKRIFDNSIELGSMVSKLSDCIVIGESIPGGTTTALAFLTSLGIDAKFKVSSSMPNNPHYLKNKVVTNAINRLDNTKVSALDLARCVGDPMMITVAGISIGASRRSKVVLAGGTQMCAVLALIKSLDPSTLNNLAICTTKYVIQDNDYAMLSLVKEIANVPLIYIDPMFERSSKHGLRAYTKGFVKEGAGAGGASVVALLKRRLSINEFLAKVEEEYERCIELKV